MGGSYPSEGADNVGVAPRGSEVRIPGVMEGLKGSALKGASVSLFMETIIEAGPDSVKPADEKHGGRVTISG
jgi:hypothetical protein